MTAASVVDLAGVRWGEMGEPLRDPEYFRQVRIDPESRTVVWLNGFDLGPDVLHGDYHPAPEQRTAALRSESRNDTPAAGRQAQAFAARGTRRTRLAARVRCHCRPAGAPLTIELQM